MTHKLPPYKIVHNGGSKYGIALKDSYIDQYGYCDDSLIQQERDVFGLTKEDAEFIITACNSYYSHLAEIDMLKERIETLTTVLKKANDVIIGYQYLDPIAPDNYYVSEVRKEISVILTPPEQTQGEQE